MNGWFPIFSGSARNTSSTFSACIKLRCHPKTQLTHLHFHHHPQIEDSPKQPTAVGKTILNQASSEVETADGRIPANRVCVCVSLFTARNGFRPAEVSSLNPKTPVRQATLEGRAFTHMCLRHAAPTTEVTSRNPTKSCSPSTGAGKYRHKPS